jgi:carboxyl-terminal processing protease
MKAIHSRERILWAVVTVVLLAALAFFAFSPPLLAQNVENETQEYLSTIAEVFRFVRDNYVDVDKAMPKALFEGALKGLFEALGDPYSAYFTAEDIRVLDDTTTGQYAGVGLTITKLDKVGAEVVSPIEGSPAYKAGIAAGDFIIKVNGEEMADLAINEISKRLRGQPNTEVAVTIRRGESVIFDVKILREVIEVPTVKRTMMPGSMGYLRISQFTALTYERCREAIKYFQDSHYTSLIIDVRKNPGGLLSSAIDVANLFIAEGTIVSTHSDRSDGQNSLYTASRRKVMVDQSIPIAVLMDKGSASAAEILAGALNDNDRATLFGTNTYGKGSVQQVRKLDNDGFKLTMSRYYTPSGAMIEDKVGIAPDILVEEPKLTPEEEKSLTDLLTGTALKDFVKANPQPSDSKVGEFIAGLRKKGILINERYLKKLVRNEVQRTNNNPPLYDMEFDLALQAAVKALSSGEIKVK